MIASQEKIWEDAVNKLNPEDKDYKKSVESFQGIKEKTKKDIEKTSNNFLKGINEEKSKANFYR